jgi:murein DD-endopeptidase MepM/ murein hydrolase activator NlpD
MWVADAGDTIGGLATMLGVEIEDIKRSDGKEYNVDNIQIGDSFTIGDTSSQITINGNTYGSCLEYALVGYPVDEAKAEAEAYQMIFIFLFGWVGDLFSNKYVQYSTEGLKEKVTSAFGWRVNEKGENEKHDGVDIGGKMGEPIYCVLAGEVTNVVTGKVKGDSGYGNYVEVTTADGKMVIYAHLKDVSVKKGDSVVEGQQIGTMGNSGNTRGVTGVHLHLEVRLPDGTIVDPLAIIRNSPVNTGKVK